MGHYPYTLFNGVTVFIFVLTCLLVWQRFRGKLSANWPLVGYAIIVGYTIGFSGGLNPYWVVAGVTCGLAIRFGFHPAQVRWLEMIPLAYVASRCIGLLLMW